MNEKNKINWVRKLTSRKFWLAIAAFVSGLIVAFGGNSDTAETVSGSIMAGAAVVAYAIGEGLADSAPSVIEMKNEEDNDNV
ncbi:MAG: hypothetical protein IJZ95_07235 [Oscillospiraceae bacterium]|nr:hypothetical protein [Oscillospiraceae bacterium]